MRFKEVWVIIFFFFQKRHNLKEHVKFVKMYKISKASQICDNNDNSKWYCNSNSLDSVIGILWWTILKNKNSGLYFSTKNYYTFLFNDRSVVCGKSFFLSFPRNSWSVGFLNTHEIRKSAIKSSSSPGIFPKHLWEAKYIQCYSYGWSRIYPRKNVSISSLQL